MIKLKIFFIFLLFFVSIPSVSALIQQGPIDTTNYIIQEKTEQWISDPGFSLGASNWFQSKSGDLNDLSLESNQNDAKFDVLGEKRNFSYNFDANDVNNWYLTHNPNFPAYPTNFTINSSGIWVAHDWYEIFNSENNVPSVHYARNMSIPVDFTDYSIVNVNLEAVINATVDINVDVIGDSVDQSSVYDHVRFYILIEDLTASKSFEIGYYQSSDLGQNSTLKTTLNDQLIPTIPKDILIYYLNSVLSTDNQNFRIKLGINIYSEDNLLGADRDQWLSLYFKAFRFSFEYEKKINQLSKASWTTIGNKLIGSNLEVLDAKLFFEYKIDNPWTSKSPNSEIQILINNNQHSESIKLSTADSDFKSAYLNGFDVASLIQKDVNITTSIQIYIADNFQLDQRFSITIDNVILNIHYRIVEPRIFLNWLPYVYALSVGFIVLGIYLIAYRVYFRYPQEIRKIKRLRYKISRKNIPREYNAISLEQQVKQKYIASMELLKLPLHTAQHVGESEKKIRSI